MASVTETPSELDQSWLKIDLDAYRHNVRAIMSRLNCGAGLMAVIKANAYGHGMIEVAKAVLSGGAQHLGVAYVEEGIELRQAGITAPILVLGPCLPPVMPDGIRHDLTFALSSEEEISLLAEKTRAAHQGLDRGKRTKVHLKVDTGMGRAGFSPDELWPAVERVLAEKTLALEGTFTHFSSAEEPDPSATREQIRMFRTLLRNLDEKGVRFRIKHMANSAATVLFPESQLDMVRCGALLHGLRAWDPKRDGLELLPALSWHTRIIHLCKRPQGWTVGYNRRHRCPRESYLATLPAGYRDGYRRALTGRGEVMIRGHRLPVVGTISMDFIVVDVTALKQTPEGLPELGDEVTLVGCAPDGTDRISIEEIASASGTLPYVVTTQMPNTLKRVFKASIVPENAAAENTSLLDVMETGGRKKPIQAAESFEEVSRRRRLSARA